MDNTASLHDFVTLTDGRESLSCDVGGLSRAGDFLTPDVGPLSGEVCGLTSVGDGLTADVGPLTFDVEALTFDVGALTFDVFGLKHDGNSLISSTFRRKQQKHP